MARAMRLRVSCSEGRGGKSDVGQRAATSGARRYGCSVIADPVPIIAAAAEQGEGVQVARTSRREQKKDITGF